MSPVEAWATRIMEQPIPFVDKGRTRAGLDCWGLCRLWFLEGPGIELPSYADQYGSTKDHAAIAEAVKREVAATCRALPAPLSPEYARAERPGDVISLRVEGLPIHLGLVLGSGWFLHAAEGLGICREEYRAPAWRRRVLGFYRPLALEAAAWA